MNWYNEVHEEMGWFEELRKEKIVNGEICGSCGEWPEYCACCNASISGKCLAITYNEPFCHPECDRIERSDKDGGG